MSTDSNDRESLNRRMRVLVVEDEPRLRHVLTRAIPDMGFDVAESARGDDALRVFEIATPDIVVLDLNLPDMDGIELFEIARKSWPSTEFIILTGFGSLEAAKQAIRLDVVDFLTKPASLGELEFALDRARRRRMGTMELPPNMERETSVAETPPEAEPAGTLADIERAKIMEALRLNDGNRSAAARQLGISLRKLYYRIAEYQHQGYQI